MEDLEQQRDEVQALSSIYGKDFVLEEFTNDYQVYSMEFQNDAKTIEVKLTVKLPPTYPSQIPPSFELSSPYLNGPTKAALGERLNEIFVENVGQPVLYQCFEEVRGFVATFNQDCVIHEKEVVTSTIGSNKAKESKKKEFSFVTSDPIIDRKSIFQGHATEISSRNDVVLALQQLKVNTKIQRATHNIYAYRIRDGNILQQDCDDDGENQAGSRLLHLLQMTEAENVLIVVSRWYGGIQLGAARFKHINNAARQALDKSNNGNVASAKNKKN
ncbi:protein IMPACT homolog [Bradysia coprophila]|uniref:protein IMPACT homolog n=1 Tax=Bradysia coprophila TaxID=38358 RepID=UPI00187DCCE0|nr:protein IMPACT homolog [Bradysia coprophila]XP_037036835.1 protein IMPACT homolog [Bradysia coprophila]